MQFSKEMAHAIAIVCIMIGVGCGVTPNADKGSPHYASQDATKDSPQSDITTKPFDPQLAQKLQKTLDVLRIEHKALGLAAAVISDGALWVGTSGFADIAQKQALKPSDRFRIASVTKTLTATLAMKLVEDGKLNLDDSLDQWYPQIRNAAQITVRQLLNHTSGIPDYLATDAYGNAMKQAHTPDQLIAYVAASSNFAPGTSWEYSNTNYTLLGQIIEKVSEAQYASEIQRRLLDPLNLKNSSITTGAALPGVVTGTYQEGAGAIEDVTTLEFPGNAMADGGMITTPADLMSWGQALYSGAVLSEDSFRQMVTVVPQSLEGGLSYGLGVEIDKVAGAQRFGHSGLINGFCSDLRYVPSRKLGVAIMSNSEALNIYAVSARLWQELLP